MGQAFAIAIVAWTTCFVATILISLFTRPKPAEAMRGLVYGLSSHEAEVEAHWFQRPWALATFVLICAFALNFALR
jgi:SSS family solute:Na+ symporter